MSLAIPGRTGADDRQAPPPGFEPHDHTGLFLLAGQLPEQRWAHVVGLPFLTGTAVSDEWPRLQPEPDRFVWESLDRRVAIIAKANKKVGLRVLPGVTVPDWVYQRGARVFEFVDRNPYHGTDRYPEGHRNATLGQKLRLPVPWDEPFLVAWEGFVAALGKRLEGQPITMVHVTGPTRHSAEMLLPRGPEDREHWKQLGYSPEKLIMAWQRCIDAFGRSFPSSALALDLGPAIFDDGVVESVVEWALDRYGARIFLQNNILLAQQERRRLDWAVLERHAGRATIGFGRMPLRLGRDTDRGEARGLRRRNFQGMFVAGMELGATYFEIGWRDARDFPEVAAAAASALDEAATRPPPPKREEAPGTR